MTIHDKSSIHSYAETPLEALTYFEAESSTDLAQLIVNDQLNDFISNYSASSFSEDRESTPIPFQGWFWRAVDFFSPRGITIAEGDGQVAVCQSNKWDYPQRDLTDTERGEFLALVWSAWQVSRAGGVLSEIQKNTRDELIKAGEFIAGLGGPFND